MLDLPFYQTSVNIHFYQINGKKVASFKYEKNLPMNKISFALPTSLSRGVYLISLRNNGKLLNQRIVIQ